MFGKFSSGFGDLSKLTNALNFDDLQADLDPELLTPEQLAQIEQEKIIKAEKDEANRIAKIEAEKVDNDQAGGDGAEEEREEEEGGGDGGDDWDDWGDEPKKKTMPKKVETKENTVTKPLLVTQTETTNIETGKGGFFGFVSESSSNLLQSSPFSLDSLQTDNQDDNQDNNQDDKVVSNVDHSGVKDNELEELRWTVSVEKEQRVKFQDMVRTYADDMVISPPYLYVISISLSFLSL